MKSLLLYAFFLFQVTGHAQVSIQTATLENGLNYPVIQHTKDQSVAKKMNERIHAVIDSLETAEFCVGDFGYVLRGPYLQIHLFHNCDFEWDQTHLYLNFWIYTGDSFDPKDMFLEEKTVDLNTEIYKRLKQHKSANCEGFSNTDDLLSIADMVFHKNGLQFKLVEKEGCNEASAILAWTDLEPFLKEVH